MVTTKEGGEPTTEEVRVCKVGRRVIAESFYAREKLYLVREIVSVDRTQLKVGIPVFDEGKARRRKIAHRLKSPPGSDLVYLDNRGISNTLALQIAPNEIPREDGGPISTELSYRRLP
jgi:hypothetical protein